MAEKLRVCVVGTGSIAQIVHLPILQSMDNVELVGICDTDKAKLSHLTSKYDNVRAYSVIDNMLKKEKPDALHICTPSLYHFPMALMALDMGAHVLVEKPLALKAEEGRKLAQTAKANKRELMVGMHNRFRPDVRLLRELLQKEELGEVFYIKSGWLRKYDRHAVKNWHGEKKSAGGGVLMDMGLPLIDLALFLTDYPEISRVRSFNYSLNPELEVEDAALAVLQTKSGATMTIEVSWQLYLEKDTLYTHIFGRNGTAKLNPLRINRLLHGNLVSVSPLHRDMGVDQFKKAYENEIRHFYKVINGEFENTSTAEEACQALEILDALYKSAETGTEVEIAGAGS